MQEGETETAAELTAAEKIVENEETPPLAAVPALTADADDAPTAMLEAEIVEEQIQSNETALNADEATALVNVNGIIEAVTPAMPMEESLADKLAESDGQDDEIDDETKENYEGFNGTGRTVTLQMLMSANVLQPGKSVMTIEYLGQKFVGDLLADGKIKSQETETIFLTPSAWAMHCKRIINPEKKSGCGWASVKYKGKKLDVYKNTWLRKCALQKESTPDDDGDKKSDSPMPVIKRTVFPHNTISNRNLVHDANMLVEAVPFTAISKLQPFLLTLSTSALLLADFHAHLSMHEICGYLGGSWDMNSHTLSITKAYPCRNTRHDRQKAAEVEREIQKLMQRDQITLVGWYHSHPKFQAEPTLRDCDSQLDYQIRMRGPSDITYTPCVSLIISSYYDENPTLESVVKSIWVIPPNENKQSIEYGRPMLMQYSVLPDKEVSEQVRHEMQICVDYYAQFRNELVKFNSIFNEDITYIEKLKNTLYPKFPLNGNDKELWNSICEMLDCEQEEDFIPPKTIKIIDTKPDIPDVIKTEMNSLAHIIETSKNDILAMKDGKYGMDSKSIMLFEEQQQQIQTAAEQKVSELKVLSLQEQLCLPSGLNMNPVRMLSPLATPNPTATATTAVPTILAPTPVSNVIPPPPPAVSLLPPTISNNNNNNLLQITQTATTAAALVTSTNNVTSTSAVTGVIGASPRDSPITILSNSASPAKFELPVRASPSPAKSDTSSHTSRTRNSPAPSPGKFSISGDLTRNSPSVTPSNNSNNTTALLPPVSAGANSMSANLPTANDLMAASLAQLAGQLPQNFLQADLAALFSQQQQPQQQRKDYGNSSLNQLAAAAAKAGANNSQKQQQQQQQQQQNMNNNNSNTIGNNVSDLSTTDANVAAAVAAYTNNFNIPRVQEKSKSERSSKSSSSSSSSSTCSSTTNSYRTKLMKELDDLKNDPLKMSELMRSPEYAALLLQQAEALGASTLGNLGAFGQDFNYLAAAGGLSLPTGNVLGGSNSKSKSSASSSAAAAAAAANAALTADYNNLIQASKLLGYDAYLQQAKSNDPLNAFLQQQMAAAINVPTASNAKKLQQQQQQQAAQQQQQAAQQQQAVQQQQQQAAAAAAAQAHPDYAALLQTYSKLFDTSGAFGNSKNMSTGNMHHELSALLAAGVGGMGGHNADATNVSAAVSNSNKQKQQKEAAHAQQLQHNSDMLNQLLQSEKQQSELNALLYHHQNKAAADLNALFATPNAGKSSAAATSAALSDQAAYYNALAQEKMQDYAAFFQQQHGKYGIPDPLAKSTLAANNLFMSPSALLKLQQESLNAMMMKPPKSTSSASSGNSMNRQRESSASPALERLTPTKSAVANAGSAAKYNFSAVDLAISSVPSNTPSPAPSDGSNSSSHRRPTNTPPVDLSRLYGELMPPQLAAAAAAGMTKKRMEFSSIADLAAPPPAKMHKPNEDVLNLSNE